MIDKLIKKLPYSVIIMLIILILIGAILVFEIILINNIISNTTPIDITEEFDASMKNLFSYTDKIAIAIAIIILLACSSIRKLWKLCKITQEISTVFGWDFPFIKKSIEIKKKIIIIASKLIKCYQLIYI